MRVAFSSIDWNTGSNSPGELEMTRSTSEVAVCCSSDSASCSRASASSWVRASSCFFNSISELGPLLTRALAFVPVLPRVGLFAPLKDKVTSSAQSLVPLRVGGQGSSLSILTEPHDELAPLYPNHVIPRACAVWVRLKRSLAALAHFARCLGRRPFAASEGRRDDRLSGLSG